VDLTSYPNVPGITGYYLMTHFRLKTAGAPGPDAPQLRGYVVANVAFVLQISNLKPGSSYRIQATRDYSLWTTLSTFTALNAEYAYPDLEAARLPYRFYRVVSP
jgi:hypothetical protein